MQLAKLVNNRGVSVSPPRSMTSSASGSWLVSSTRYALPLVECVLRSVRVGCHLSTWHNVESLWKGNSKRNYVGMPREGGVDC